MSTPESKVRDPTVKWAKAQGILHQRMSFRIGVKQAWPDDVFLLPHGRPLFIEFKRPDGHPTDLQLQRMKDLNELGYDAIWTDNKDAACHALALALERSALYGASVTIFTGPLRGGFTAKARRTEDLNNLRRVSEAEIRRARGDDAGNRAASRMQADLAPRGYEVVSIQGSNLRTFARTKKGRGTQERG